ncbi:MAG TPA: PIG-L family deacetylase [Terriglobales bacterium]|nr:PIG-L family deacetylase [Terriglobales bacterium]
MNAEVWPKKFRSLLLTLTIPLLVILTNSAQTAGPSSAKSEPGFLDPLPQDTGALGLKQELRRLQNTGRLMMVVAHPDDEDGGLLTRESRGQGVTTLLQTLTRGEGGQNKTGNTFSDELGILRVLELLAADRYYGVEDRFTRVADFGYSKTADETFQKWGGHDVPLSDIVRTIREFRPDVLIARFSGTEADGHGHHQASAILTKEAFRAAADPNRFSDQIKQGLLPWQPKKLYIGNVCGFGASTCPDENWTVKINTGEDDPLLGMSYVQFAIAGLRHQQSQGLGDIRIPSGPRYAFYRLVDSVLPNTKDDKGHEKDFFDGIDTNIAAIAGTVDPRAGDKIRQAAAKINLAEKSAPGKLDAVVAPLLSVLDLLNGNANIQGKTPEQRTALVKVENEEQHVRTAINLALNVELTASLVSPPGSVDHKAMPAISPGQNFAVKVTFHNGSPLPLRLDSVVLSGTVTDHGVAVDDRANQLPVASGQNYEHIFQLRAPETVPFTKPGFHRNDPQRDSIYTIDQPQLMNTPFISALPAFARASFEMVGVATPKSSAGLTTTNVPEISAPVTVPIKNIPGAPDKAELAVVPAFSVAIDPGDQVVPASGTSPIKIHVKVSSNLEGPQNATVRLQAPPDSQTSPLQQPVSLSHRGDEKSLEFEFSPAAMTQGGVKLRAVLSNGNMNYSESYTLVTREDLGSFYYFQPSVQRISIVDVKIPRNLKVGYIIGAGDDIPSVLRETGMNVTLIPADKIATENLSQFDTIVLGVRAYDTQPELVNNNKRLLDYVSNGGTLIVQNNNSVGDFNSGHFTPYPADLSRARVSVEEAPVTILDPGNPIFHYPNEISQKDFDGWVQERGLYFMSSWDDHFKPLLSCHDPGEPDQKGGLLVAKYGKGTYIYTGYSFFRQLPAGVPGAIRLFVNLVSAGHQP